MIRLSCLFLPFLFLSNLLASDFNQGVKAFRDGQLEPAYENFIELDKQYPNNPTLLFNIGLIQYKAGKRGLALGLWRKARYFGNHPQIETAIHFVEEELGMATTNEGFFNTMIAWIRGIPLNLWMALLIALTLGIGWPAVNFFAKRKLPLSPVAQLALCPHPCLGPLPIDFQLVGANRRCFHGHSHRNRYFNPNWTLTRFSNTDFPRRGVRG